MASEPRAIQSGEQGAFRWLTSREYDIDELLERCPQVVLGRYVAITSFDSGSLIPSPDEVAEGWRSSGGIAYSPRIHDALAVPHDQYDEWYVLDAPEDLGKVSDPFSPEATSSDKRLYVFVNYGFAPGDPVWEEERDMLLLFWHQIEEVRPVSYIADGDVLTFVTRDQDLFSAVLKNLRA